MATCLVCEAAVPAATVKGLSAAPTAAQQVVPGIDQSRRRRARRRSYIFIRHLERTNEYLHLL